ncbi:hypothetical protein CC85DRAFT_328560 [Cutaneotrichosporon oleaginosum]|uniref:Uncharacterized protein n=1 Tax=Cutaneotrichosporon oleaginosum TaxID=879819 RepID=A0A0J0XLM4_9TREE|nr:uncharacterized protein CC85DRAFT_328560 [Cutaneotrichosporon oleaginosum]KLT41995.1 hypothetical protein CC85DRAFT_328560 [Cutaneotrichosporon oleaginosum]TXT14346.1 hypothetical protein COLE_00539 [Cutaneotrichosporon oleaginosum]
MTIDQVTLYGLGLRPGQNINVGPYAWKTAVDLGLLSIPYRLEGRTFAEIRTSWESETVAGITVPAIQDGERWVFDSFRLAQYLEDKYGGKRLFPRGQEIARFLNTWADRDLGGEIVPLFAPWLYKAQEPDSSAWFLKQKLGGDQDKIDALVLAVQDPAFIERQAAAVRAKLATLEAYLAANEAEGAGPFLAGETASHADAAVWGWYAASLAVRHPGVDLGALIWKHESLPLVGAWVDAVQKAAGVELLLE